MVDSKPRKPIPKPSLRPIPRENPFRSIGGLLRNSVERLPTHLVVIFCAALAITVLFGLVFKVTAGITARNAVYLPERLSPQDDAPVILERDLRGVWVLTRDSYVATLRLANGIFEIVVRSADAPVSRYYIRGGYRLDGNVLIFEARKDLGSPYDPQHLEYQYYPLSFSNVNVYAGITAPAMIWRTPPREERRIERLENSVRAVFSDGAAWLKIGENP